MKDPVEETIKVYDEIAEEWTARYGNLDFMRDFADLFIDNLEGKRILDLGCGPGRDARYFSENNFEVVGIDLSESFLKLARQNAPRAEFRKMDLTRPEFPREHFDGVWAAASALHIPKKQAGETLKQVSSVMKKGGILYLSLLEGVGERYTNIEFGNGRFFAYYAKEEIKEILESLGFRIIEIYPSPGDVHIEMQWLNVFAVKK